MRNIRRSFGGCPWPEKTACACTCTVKISQDVFGLSGSSGLEEEDAGEGARELELGLQKYWPSIRSETRARSVDAAAAATKLAGAECANTAPSTSRGLRPAPIGRRNRMSPPLATSTFCITPVKQNTPTVHWPQIVFARVPRARNHFRYPT